MSTMKLEFHSIGTVHSPFQELSGMPIQPPASQGARGRVIVNEEYAEGLLDLEGFSHIILLYVFHRCRGYNLQVTPFLDTVPRGLFATRAPRRPNPIGLSVVQLEAVEGNVLYIRDVDVLDGTPLLDIKPYVPYYTILREQCGPAGWKNPGRRSRNAGPTTASPWMKFPGIPQKTSYNGGPVHEGQNSGTEFWDGIFS
ncbi:MAG: tRNA (N6-threonylcarbamoyladenosine(37)-N6)-methyltransferase TrmO [Spirochaetota bacterium]|nr:tRNA (N6-threonylcarbamoyladenosine(37)-N6)-methyltransferase TrmO [Spirochaetota bacterium]